MSLTHNVTVNCIFLSGFTGSAHCTVQYGTDPTYMNLPYSAESTETGTAGDSVSVILTEQLNSSTVYYYTVSVISNVHNCTHTETCVFACIVVYMQVHIQSGLNLITSGVTTTDVQNLQQCYGTTITTL